MDDFSAPFNARLKYTHFRILVIGRANAGKTTLLKRVCNTTEEPSIYDEKNNDLLTPTAKRGIHDVRRAFNFSTNPEFIFHDSPGFETGDETQLKEVQQFIHERAKATDVDDQFHAIWFCLVTNAARPLLELEQRFFNEERHGNAPVIVIFTKFDDLISQIYDIEMDEDQNRAIAETELKEKFKDPLLKCAFPPRAQVVLEDMQDNEGKHQDQVKELTKKTADSIDNLALKMLFVSLQQNNLELCIHFAIKYRPSSERGLDKLVYYCLSWFRHSYIQAYDYGKKQENLILCQAGLLQQGLAQQYTNSEAVTNIIKPIFMNSSLQAFGALMLCGEHSFWHLSPSVPFIDAFQMAFLAYQNHGLVEKMATALSVFQGDRYNFNERLEEILLMHRLSPPKDNVSQPGPLIQE